MHRPALVRAATVAAIVALGACSSGTGSPASLRTTDGPTSTILAGSTPEPGHDETAQGIAGLPTGTPGGSTVPGPSAGGGAGPVTAGQVGGEPAAGLGAPASPGTGGAGAVPGGGAAVLGDTSPAPANESPTAVGTSLAPSGTSPGPSGSGATTTNGPAPGSGPAPGGASSPAAVVPASDPAAYCQAQRTLDSRLAGIDPQAGPAQLRASVSSAWAAIGPARDTAPAEVSGDVGVVTGAYGRLFVAFDQAGYDISRVSVGVFQEISPSAIQGASDRIAAYMADNC